MLFAGTTFLTDDRGYMLLWLPITVPGFSTEPHPTSTSSPNIAPNFFDRKTYHWNG